MAYPDQIYAAPGNWDDPYVSPLGQVIRQGAPIPSGGQSIKHALKVAALSQIPFIGRMMANQADDTWQHSMPAGRYPWDEKLPDGSDPNGLPSLPGHAGPVSGALSSIYRFFKGL